jgi:hypothetical protein
VEELCRQAALISGVTQIANGLHKAQKIAEGSFPDYADELTFEVDAPDFFTKRLFERDMLIAGLCVALEYVDLQTQSGRFSLSPSQDDYYL